MTSQCDSFHAFHHCDTPNAAILVHMFDERLLTLLILAGFIGTVTRSPALLGLVLLSATFVLIGYQLRRFALRGIGYRRTFDETRLFLGEYVTLSCTAINRGRLPIISLHILDSAPKGFRSAGNDHTVYTAASGRLTFSHLMALQPGEQASRQVILQPMRRGYYVFGEVEMRAADLLGMSEAD